VALPETAASWWGAGLDPTPIPYPIFSCPHPTETHAWEVVTKCAFPDKAPVGPSTDYGLLLKGWGCIPSSTSLWLYCVHPTV
jgi:hypothetical protein